jgi:hypothetical protein
MIRREAGNLETTEGAQRTATDQERSRKRSWLGYQAFRKLFFCSVSRKLYRFGTKPVPATDLAPNRYRPPGWLLGVSPKPFPKVENDPLCPDRFLDFWIIN